MADVEGAKNKAHEDAKNILNTADTKADEALSGIEQGAKGGNDPSMGEKASGATEQAKEHTGSAWESAKQGTADETEKTKDNTGKAWESTKQGTSDASEATNEKAGEAKDESASMLQKAGEKAQEAASKVYGALDKANRYETYQSKE